MDALPLPLHDAWEAGRDYAQYLTSSLKELFFFFFFYIYFFIWMNEIELLVGLAV